jgi:phospholipid/cholesterol/gamma-HCH transport system ATP-binding protein
MSNPVIEFRGVGLKFGSTIIHRDLTFSVYPDESITILGPSGAGKTLLLKMIAGLVQPTTGDVLVFGRSTRTSEDRLQILRRRIGMVFQGAALFDSLTVYENIAYSLRERNIKDEPKIAAVVREKLAIVGLSGTEEKLPGQLSGGQRKRIGLARALASSPEVMLYDEPTTGLDPTAVRRIDDLIVRLNREFHIVSISVTHDMESARRISKRWILIHNGTIAADGPADSVCATNDLVRDFVNGTVKNPLDSVMTDGPRTEPDATGGAGPSKGAPA